MKLSAISLAIVAASCGRFGIEAELDQLPFFGRFDLQAAGDLPVAISSRVDASPSVADEVLVVGEVEILRGALGDAAARQQPDLGRDEIPVADRRRAFALTARP